MDLSQKILQHIVFPKNCPQQLISYTFKLIIACGGFPGDIHFGQGIQEFNAVFFSPHAQGKFNEYYGKALQEDFVVSIWEKANGPIISEEKRLCLLEFHKVLKEIRPVIKFIEENGGWPTPEAANGFEHLDDATLCKTLPIELKVSSDKLQHIMIIFSFVCDTIAKYPNIESLSKEKVNLSFRRNILQLYGEFGIIYSKMLPLINFIEANGGWPDSDGGDFPGFTSLRSTCSAGNLSQEVMTSLDNVENFMDIYLSGEKFFRSQNPAIQIIPHNQV